MNDLNKIKKYYGENMMHLCRDLFPTLLEQDNLLFSLLDSNFAHSKFLYDDIIEENLIERFKNYIYSLVEVEKDEIEVIKTPKELLDAAGYILYECKSESDIQFFKKYYKLGEELCTFHGERLKRCYVFFAIKKNVDDIKRENFPHPQRQDEYGTSVISIQFSKGPINTLSIKNRYNHTVNNPDATFGNNLENIIPGLTKSFEKEYNLSINQNNNKKFILEDYVKADDRKYYRHNYEIDNVYYCSNNIIIDNFEVKKYSPEKYLIVDYFIIDLVNKKITLYDNALEDSFIDGLKDIKKIEINKLNENKIIKITLNNDNVAYIEIDKYNKIISYKNEFLTEVTDGFLYMNVTLKEINLPNVKIIGDDFLCDNEIIHKIDIKNVITIGNDFLVNNEILSEINIPKVKTIGTGFLFSNKMLKKLNLPQVKLISKNFLYFNEKLEQINLPIATIIQDDFLSRNEEITQINLPKVITIGNNFLANNKKLNKINLPKVEIIGNDFLYFNQMLQAIALPRVREIGDSFINHNEILDKINLPNNIIIGKNFLFWNDNIKKTKVKKSNIKIKKMI